MFNLRFKSGSTYTTEEKMPIINSEIASSQESIALDITSSGQSSDMESPTSSLEPIISSSECLKSASSTTEEVELSTLAMNPVYHSPQHLESPPTSLPSRKTPPTSPSLTTIPPEILLQIISHLPHTSAFLSLVQTSHGLRLFFANHTPSICATHIEKHYALASTLLHTQLKDGWLLPTHPTIVSEHLTYRPSSSTSPSPSPSPSQYRSPSPSPFLSTSPSILNSTPLYLHFLETNAWKIEYAYERACAASSTNDSTDRLSSEQIPDEDVERKFANELALFVLRPWLRSCEWNAEEENTVGEQDGTTSAAALPSPTGINHTPHLRNRMKKLATTIRDKTVHVLGGCIGKPRKSKAKTQKPLFGEVVGQEKMVLKRSSPAEQIRKALLWYDGETGVRKFPLVDVERLGMGVVVEHVEDEIDVGLEGDNGEVEKKGMKMKKRFEGFGKSFRGVALHASSRALISFRCVAGFESLE